MDGILNINKPRGKTSFGIVSIVRRLLGESRVGHAGTLDPAATGVLPVCLGQGTRIVEFLVNTTKTYRAEIELGVTTDTYDADGQIVDRKDCSGISLEQLTTTLSTFCGLIPQTPPMYSALKHHGKPLYQLARAGLTVERGSRLTSVHSLKLIYWQPPVATIEVVCGKGTYIRSLAHDLGQTLGCGAHLKNLLRSRCGIFDIRDAVSIPQFEDAVHGGYWQHLAYPIDSVLLDLKAMVVNDNARESIQHGRPFVLENSSQPEECEHPGMPDAGGILAESRYRAYALDGCFLGVLRFNAERGQWQPEKVFR